MPPSSALARGRPSSFHHEKGRRAVVGGAPCAERCDTPGHPFGQRRGGPGGHRALDPGHVRCARRRSPPAGRLPRPPAGTGAPVRRAGVRLRGFLVRIDSRSRPSASGGRDRARLPGRSSDRPHVLDPRGLRGGAQPGGRALCPIAANRALAGLMGDARASPGDVSRGDVDRHPFPSMPISRPVGRSLARREATSFRLSLRPSLRCARKSLAGLVGTRPGRGGPRVQYRDGWVVARRQSLRGSVDRSARGRIVPTAGSLRGSAASVS